MYIRDDSILNDFKKGGSKSFSEIRDLPPAPTAFITSESKAAVRRVRWPKTGLQKLPLSEPMRFEAFP